MSLQRLEIRKSIVAMLKAKIENFTDIDVKMITANRYFPVPTSPDECEAKLPLIGIYMRSESAVINTVAPRRLKRTVPMVIEIVVGANENFDDDIDYLCSAVEKVIHSDDTLNGSADDCVMTGTEVDVSMDGEIPFGAARMTFDATYYTDAPEEQDLKDFEGLDYEVKSKVDQALDGAFAEIDGTVNVREE